MNNNALIHWVLVSSMINTLKKYSLVIGVILAVSMACRGLSKSSANESEPTLPVISTLSPPLQNVYFPPIEVAYPDGWPIKLQYPDQFTLVEANSGVMPENNTIVWAVKLRYEGDPQSAASLLLNYFTEINWQIAEQTTLDSGGILLLIEENNKGTGILVIDSEKENPDFTTIVATIFQK